MDEIMNIINQYSQFILIGAVILTFLLFIVVIILICSVSKLKKKYTKLMKGANSKSLENLIIESLADIEKSLANSQQALNRCEEIRNEMKDCLSRVAIKRYKAFEDVGCDLSFSIALLDDFYNGIILTGIYSRHDNIIYAKPVSKGVSKYELSSEEKQVLTEAMSK